MEPQFTIILPTHNRVRLLKRAVESALHQSLTDFELIIVDDGSIDGTSDYLQTLTDDGRVRSIRHSSAKGVSAARNSGILAASGPFVAFLDDDDELLPDFLARQKDHFIRHPSLGWSWTGIRRVFWHDERSIREERDQCWLVADVQKRYLTQLAASHGVTVRKDWLLQIGGFDGSMVVAEDLDLLMRLEGAGALGVPIPEVLIRIHIHPGPSLSRNSEYVRFVQSYRTLIENNKAFLEMYPNLWCHQHDSLFGHLYRTGDVKAARTLAWKIICRNPLQLSVIEKFFRFEIKRLKNLGKICFGKGNNSIC